MRVSTAGHPTTPPINKEHLASDEITASGAAFTSMPM